jgi:hypothetical protein
MGLGRHRLHRHGRLWHGRLEQPRSDDCKVDYFKIEAQNGGSVVITFRIIAHPESEDVGKLCEFMQREIILDLLPPALQTFGELFGEAA